MCMEIKRCSWLNTKSPQYVTYHDEEWGVPVHDDRILFEFMVLESAQAGLSWETILKKREGYRALFKDFDPMFVSQLTPNDVDRLLKDDRIVRNRLKVEATITNARAFLDIQKEFGSFETYVWNWVGGTPILNTCTDDEQLPVVTELAIRMAKDLKKRGFRFLGPTTWYAYMQAVGLVNDHTAECYKHTI